MELKRNLLGKHHGKIGRLAIQICQLDITKETTDAITNASNERLQHGGGVAGAIRMKGGKAIV